MCKLVKFHSNNNVLYLAAAIQTTLNNIYKTKGIHFHRLKAFFLKVLRLTHSLILRDNKLISYNPLYKTVFSIWSVLHLSVNIKLEQCGEL